MWVANIWKAAKGDCNISIFVQFWLLPWLLQRVVRPPVGNHKKDGCMPQTCVRVCVEHFELQLAKPCYKSWKFDHGTPSKHTRCRGSSRLSSDADGRWKPQEGWWYCCRGSGTRDRLQSVSFSLGRCAKRWWNFCWCWVPRLKIHKPAIGTGGSALVFRGHYSSGEVAVKIPRPEGYEGSHCHIVFSLWIDERKIVGKDGLIAAAEASRMLAIQLGVGPEAKDPQTSHWDWWISFGF